jgi:hypothetical protein
VRISGSNAAYTMFRGRVKSSGYPLHSPISPSLHLPCVIVCHHSSTGLLTVLVWETIKHVFWSFLFSRVFAAYNMLKIVCLQHLNICILLKGSCFRNDLYLIVPKATSFTISFMRRAARLIALEQFTRVYMVLSKILLKLVQYRHRWLP